MSPASTDQPKLPVRAVVARRLLRAVCLAAIAATALVLLLTAGVLVREASWLPEARPAPEGQPAVELRQKEAFFHGTIGTEVVPLPVLKVLPGMFPEHFQPRGAEAGDWIQQFGFIPSSRSPVPHPTGESLEGLPLGFTVSHYRPKTGAPSPVKFVGLGCATCHTTLIRRGEGTEDLLVVGTGNSALNLFAWIDAFQAALLDEEKLTMPAIVDAAEQAGGKLSLEERAMITLWLTGTRARMKEDAEKYDEPYGHGRSLNPDLVPTGPVRTQPFRTLVRSIHHRPGATMKVYTKIAPVFWQDLENDWGQFDGGIHGIHRRSSGAALAAGATVQNMNLPEIAANINWASDYLATLRGPRFDQAFPSRPPDGAKVTRGKAIYMQHCNQCHGHPEGERWVAGERQGQMTPLAEIGTDPERVTFRYYEQIPDDLSTLFPKGHPFDFPREELRPAPGDASRGYINKPIHSAFSRAPYLHNASVLTLKELINLEDRKEVFFRGDNRYDPDAVGLASPREGETGKTDPKLYFRFDTRIPGNSSKGHDYPWPRKEVSADAAKQKDLGDLLEYLKTL